ncbi:MULTISPECIES: restriction endonuclease subunit S [Bacteroides]|uniref:restriction endonuclease subunit S n=1 Tax=Bacteroides TaxID=816 RepID=UPI002174FA2D|nr:MULTISPECIES: restriction endonuclease subunit S [Bacteroides]
MSQFIEMYHKTHNTQTLESVCAIISKGITPKYVDFSSVAVVNQACIQWDGQHLENIKYHNEEILFKKRTLQTGDVLLNATGTGTLGRCCVFNCPSNDNIYINDGHVIALATDKSILLPEVLKAYLSLNDTQAEIYRLYVTGSTNQVDIVFSDIKKMKVPVPDIDDQISFVKILNQADKSKFGDFKSQFIEMTTRSELNKKSIGEIAEVRTGSTPSRSNPEYWNGTHYWVSAQDMGNKYIYDTLEKITDKGYATCKVVPAGSILYVCRGSIGVMSINTMDCATNQSICTATCKKGYNTEYLYYALKVAEKTIKKQGIGTSFKSLNQSAFSSIEILFPAIEIQDKFAAIAKQADKSKSYVRIALKNLESILGYCIRQVA